jgi:hypothetical protein
VHRAKARRHPSKDRDARVAKKDAETDDLVKSAKNPKVERRRSRVDFVF